ncbi:hypothetical protein [Hydrogenimonas sp. SS33]|uniref:hypothetical protein n=1 Tax=Hydrogenimonas leucolamina TaxID=2954236 RepID=UPI00336BC4C2
MKKALILALGLLFVSGAWAKSEEVTKKGFLASEWCVKHDMFKDCRLESYACGSEGCFAHWKFGDRVTGKLVLFVHDEGKYYYVDLGKIEPSELDEAKNANEVTFTGHYDPRTNTIHATEFKAPPPPKKSFFKGCL